MHEGKHGILDGVEDMDDLFGLEDDEEEIENEIKNKDAKQKGENKS